MPAANRLSFMFFGRSYQQCDNFGQLLESVQKEFAYIKETQLYLDFFNMIRATSRWPRLMQWGLRRSDSMATAVLTYVGDVTRGTYRAFPVVDNTRPVGDAILTSHCCSSAGTQKHQHFVGPRRQLGADSHLGGVESICDDRDGLRKILGVV